MRMQSTALSWKRCVRAPRFPELSGPSLYCTVVHKGTSWMNSPKIHLCRAMSSRFPCIRSTEQARQPRPTAYYFAAPVRYYWLLVESGTLEQKLPCLGKISADHLTSSRRQQGRTMPTSPFGKAYVSTLAAPLLAEPRSSRSLHAFLVQHYPQGRYESSDLRTSS